MPRLERTPDEAKRINAAIVGLAEVFQRTASGPLVMTYQLALNDIPVEDIERACVAALREPGRKFMPTPGELIEMSGEGTAEHRAILAWGALQATIGIKANSYDHVDFDDPLINATVRSLGGWPQLLDRTAADFDKFTRPQFIRVYADLYRHGVDGDMCRPLAGLSDTGQHAVMRIDGKATMCCLTGPVRVATGLPALPKRVTQRITHTPARRADVPRIELKTP